MCSAGPAMREHKRRAHVGAWGSTESLEPSLGGWGALLAGQGRTESPALSATCVRSAPERKDPKLVKPQVDRATSLGPSSQAGVCVAPNERSGQVETNSVWASTQAGAVTARETPLAPSSTHCWGRASPKGKIALLLIPRPQEAMPDKPVRVHEQ